MPADEMMATVTTLNIVSILGAIIAKNAVLYASQFQAARLKRL